MTMRLELRQVQGTGTPGGAAQRWYFERGRRTLGRSSDCDWQIPDTTRSVSKLHCTIERDRDGFLLRDESANGTLVDGILVLEGETARLSDKSRLECGGFAFSVTIAGEKDRDVDDPAASLAISDESLTISAILADIAPSGQAANGIMGRRDGGDWADDRLSPDPEHKSEPVPSSRNVEIGWSGPPEMAGMQPILPNDWNDNSDYGTRLEHAAAPRVAMPAARSRKQSDVTDVPLRETPAPVRREEPPRPSMVDGTDRDRLARIESLLDQCDEASRACFAILDIEPDVLADAPDFLDARREDIVLARLGTMLERQSVLNAALDGLFRQASHAMEPRIIEARVDAEPRRLPWRSDRSYWQAYRRQFDDNGNTIPVRAFLRKAMLQALGATEGDEAEMTEKEKPTHEK